MTDLKQLSAKELLELSREAIALAEAKKDDEKKALRARIIEQIHDAGYTLDDIFPGASPLKSKASGKSQAEAKYRHPEDPALTWSGRGRKPNWLAAEEAAGRALSEFLIQPE